LYHQTNNTRANKDSEAEIETCSSVSSDRHSNTQPPYNITTQIVIIRQPSQVSLTHNHQSKLNSSNHYH